MILLAGSVVLYHLKTLRFYPFTFLLFLQLGYFSMHLNNEKNNIEIPDHETYFQIKILEKSNTSKSWNKGVAEIQFMYTRSDRIESVSQKLLFYTDSTTNKLISTGDILLLSSTISKIKNKGNPGEFDASMYWKTKNTTLLSFFDQSDFSILRNEPPSYKNIIEKHLIQILENNLPKSQVGLAKALFLGDKSELTSETTRAFSAAGAMHFLAISGLHIGLMIVVLLYTFRIFSKFITRYQATILILLFIWFYAYLIGFPPSVVRSVFMFSLITLGSIFSAQSNQVNLLCFSAIILLILNPWYLFDIGFQLSYLAMFGILLTYVKIEEFYKFDTKIFRYLWNGTALGLSAQIFTIPFCLYYFHQFPNYFVLTNLGIIIMSGVLISLGAGLFIFSWSPILSIGIGLILSSLLYLLVAFIGWIEHLPGAVSKGFQLHEFEVLGLYVLIILILFASLYKTRPFYNYMIGTIILIALSFHRYNNLNEKHLIVFNNNKLCFAVHSSNQIYFFYDDLEKNEYKYQRILETYERCYPGTISKISIKDKNITYRIQNNKVSIVNKENKKSLIINDRKYQIVYDNKTKESSEINQIGMPWVKGLKTTLNKAILFPF